MKEMTFISLIAYACNDEKSIADFILKMDSFLNSSFNSYEIIIVNDASDDDTENEIFNIKDRVNGNVTVVNLWERHGVDKALFAGTDISIGDLIFEIESVRIDYPLEVIHQMYKKSSVEGHDMVFVESNRMKNITNKTYLKLLEGLSNNKISLSSSLLRLVTRRALYAMTGNKEVITNRDIMYKHCGFEWTSIAYNSEGNKAYNSKRISKRISQDLKAVMVYTKLFSMLPFFFSGLFLLATLLIPLSNAFDLGLVFFTDISDIVIVSCIFFGFSLVFLILGIMYKSITILINIGMKSNPYKVKSIKRINKY